MLESSDLLVVISSVEIISEVVPPLMGKRSLDHTLPRTFFYLKYGVTEENPE